MTATDYPTLDTLLTTAEPVDAEPFDLGELLNDIEEFDGRLSNTYDRDAVLAARRQITRHVNAERVRTEDARRWVDRLQGECAAKDAAAHEALRWLDMAATYATTEDCSAAIDDAAAALRAVTT